MHGILFFHTIFINNQAKFPALLNQFLNRFMSYQPSWMTLLTAGAKLCAVIKRNELFQ